MPPGNPGRFDSRVRVGHDIGSADVVGPDEVAGREIDAAGGDGDRLPGAEGVDRGDLPSADDLIEESVHVDRFAFSDRKLIDPAQLRHVRLMIVRDRTLEVAVEHIRNVFRVDRVIGETDRLGPGVRAKKRETALEVACDLDLKGVIRRRSDIREDVVDAGELRIRAQSLEVGPAESRVRLRDRARGAPRARQNVAILLRHAEGQVIGLRESLRDQAGTFVADVVDLHDRRCGQLVLEAEVPILNVRKAVAAFGIVVDGLSIRERRDFVRQRSGEVGIAVIQDSRGCPPQSG